MRMETMDKRKAIAALTQAEAVRNMREHGRRQGERDGKYDAETYQGSPSLLEITVVSSNRRLDLISDNMSKRDISQERYNYLSAAEAQERAYLFAYIKAWGEAKGMSGDEKQAPKLKGDAEAER